MVVAGLAGSMVGGMILDKFKKFKLTTLVTYTLSLVFMIAFTYAIDLEDINIDYFIIAALGTYQPMQALKLSKILFSVLFRGLVLKRQKVFL